MDANAHPGTSEQTFQTVASKTCSTLRLRRAFVTVLLGCLFGRSCLALCPGVPEFCLFLVGAPTRELAVRRSFALSETL